MILEDYTVFDVIHKVGACCVDRWLVNSFYESPKGDKQYYRVQLLAEPKIRPIAILSKADMDNGIADGSIVISSVDKAKKKAKKEQKDD